jgi:hypothetical protein
MKSSLKNIAAQITGRTNLLLTGEEFIAAFINPEHQTMLVDVRGMVGFVGTTSLYTSIYTSTDTKMRAYLSFKHNPPIIIPRYASNGIQPTCPPAIMAKLVEWADERHRIGCMFGDALDAIDYLNAECGDARAMAIMLPALVTIMSKNSTQEEDRMVKRAKKISEGKGFGSLPRMTPVNRERLKEISALINMAAMLENTPVDAPNNEGDAHVSLSQYHPTRSNIFAPGEASALAEFV